MWSVLLVRGTFLPLEEEIHREHYGTVGTYTMLARHRVQKDPMQACLDIFMSTTL